jgi:hypothetical protein
VQTIKVYSWIRFPVVERAAADVKMLSDPILAANIRKSAQRILRDGKENKSQSQTQLPKGSPRIIFTNGLSLTPLQTKTMV